MAPEDITSLPVYPFLGEITDSLARDRTLMLHAETGAGKTTLVPWKLLSHSAYTGLKILLLQPRRVAARAAADRIASLLGERIGQTVGLRTRVESAVGAATRLEVVTEGVLTRIIQGDQSLSKYGTVIFDEFHERNLQADMALAFAWDCRETLRPDLSILFMSAALPSQEMQAVFGAIKLISVPGRAYPVTVFYRPPLPDEKAWDGVARLADEAMRTHATAEGDVLAFLPGFREINRARESIARSYPRLAGGVAALHGQLPLSEQRAVLNPGRRAGGRIILSTNVAETSLTIPGVSAVVDSGLERRVRYLPRTGMEHWETASISAASADQRKGRAGRTGPGVCFRWWSEKERRREFSNPEILESDLAPLLLQTALWGAATPYDLKWLTAPPRAALERASALLQLLGLIDGAGGITERGRSVSGLGLHPRLGRMVLASAEKGWLTTASMAAAILEEGDQPPGDPDFRDRIAAWAQKSDPGRGSPDGDARRIVEEARRIMRAAGSEQRDIAAADIDPDLAGKLLLLAYPDRAALKTAGGETSRWILASGRGARLTGPLSNEDYIAVADLDGGETDARIFLAAPVTRDELMSGLAGEPVMEREIEWEGWKPRARTFMRLGRIIMKESHDAGLPEPEQLQRLTADRLARDGIESLPWSREATLLRARCSFIQKNGGQRNWPDFSPEALAREAPLWLLPFGNYGGGPVFTGDSILSGLKSRIGRGRMRILDTLAPEQITLPSGAKKHIDYESGEIPVIEAQIQQMFGSRETPRLCNVPVMLHLLSPAGRPVQITRDLDGFWERSYPDVKKELMGRYPRHYWPDNPRDAEPTNRAKPRKKFR
jgi:ATP-dependent helicase HrpB